MEKKGWYDIPLTTSQRKFNFCLPLKTIGYMSNHTMRQSTFYDKLEITVRLAALAEYSTDVIDGKTYVCKFPNVAFKVPGVKHQYEVTDSRDAFYFSYAPKLLDTLKSLNMIPEAHVWEIKLTSKINRIINELRKMMTQSSEYSIADKMDLLAFQLLGEILFSQNQQADDNQFIETRIRKISSFLQMNYDMDIDFNELIVKNGFSRRSFYRHWKTYYNLSPKLYVQNLKLQEASRLLVQTDYKVVKITELLNFRDSAYFCAIFKKHYGVTPLQYRSYKNGVFSPAQPGEASQCHWRSFSH